ncbi:MAG: alpha-2-macroglobulin family protein [Chloroflexota bacterium]
MKSKRFITLTVALVMAIFTSLLPACACGSQEKVESYMAVAPLVLQSGGREAVSVTLLKGEKPVTGNVKLTLLKSNDTVLEASEKITGKGVISFDVPDLEEGDYTLRVEGNGFRDEGAVKVARDALILLETDKPIYKPGQTILIRVITLNSELRPVVQEATVEIMDAKGIKVMRKTVSTDEYGMATLELPLSTEPNLGVWKLSAASGSERTQLDIRVEKYVLPKYEVKVDLERDWFLVGERIKGQVTAEYSFGKPVAGEVEIRALRYVGEWQEYTTFSRTIDGKVDFELPPTEYVAGVPGASGMGNVQLDVVVREKATGYQEETSKLLTIAQSGLNIQVIPSSLTFKPGLSFGFLVITETPDNRLIKADVEVRVSVVDDSFNEKDILKETVRTEKGKALVDITPPADAVALMITCNGEGSWANKVVAASYSPSSSFIHVEQTSSDIPSVGETVRFKVHATKEATNFYYEVIARGRVIFTDFTASNEISFPTTPLMAPSSRLLVYQILPNSEVAADYLPFKVSALYPHSVKVTFSEDEVAPGENVKINIETEGEARVGLTAVDRSVYILAENRLNLEQVFAELERLYMNPQAELHEVTLYPVLNTKGAKETFQDAQMMVLSNNKIPEGKEYRTERNEGLMERVFQLFDGAGGMQKGIPPPMVAVPSVAPAPDGQAANGGLAEVARVRQFFPETWLWEEMATNLLGRGSLNVTAPDTITTWMLRAVAISRKNGLGTAEDELRVFQPFFLSCDLPYAAIRGEEFPIRVAVYNYLDLPQQVVVQLETTDWFELLDESEKTLNINGNDIGGAEFMVRTTKLGVNQVKVSARSKEAADAVVKTVIIDAEGVARELVDNLVLGSGSNQTLATALLLPVVDGSGRAYVAVTSSYLTQTIDGLEGLIQMPFGCGEQNMIVFAPDVYITQYLKESGQLKPEIMAKAEKLMITGYQRELIYRRSDGSFSAFGESDKEGSLWLTAFVLKCFAQAKGLIYIDDSILTSASDWIKARQNGDGSFDAVGFVHHQEMLGGLKGKTALTAYVAGALLIAGERDSALKAVAYLEKSLSEMKDAYSLALTAYVLELAGSAKRAEAHDRLMAEAIEDENGIHWGGGGVVPEPLPGKPGMEIRPGGLLPVPNQTAEIETTAYATLALTKHGDVMNASRAAKWLVSKRNAYGGFGSTQDTVVALQALTEYAAGSRADVDLRVKISAGDVKKELRLNQDNYDTLQIVAVPVNQDVNISAEGKGEAIAQVVRRFNIPEAKPETEILKVDVDYDVTQVSVNDLVKVSVLLAFNPPEIVASGMVVLDVSVPTGFTPVEDSIAQVVAKEDKIKRYDVAGRKVVFYLDEVAAQEKIGFSFDVRAVYPVKAKGVTSRAYSYYQPEISGESLSRDITVLGN